VRLLAEPVLLPAAPEHAAGPPGAAPHAAVAAVAAALTRAGRRHVVAFAGEWAGGGGLVSADPRRVLRPNTAAAAFAVTDRLPAVEGEGLGDVPVGVPEGDVARDRVGSGPVGGGWFGYLGFGLADALWRSPPPLPATRLLPVAHWAWHDWVLRLDPDGAWWLEALVGVDFPAARAAEVRRSLAALPAAAAGPVEVTPVRAPDRVRHSVAVEACIRAIRHGDVFQANITAGVDLELVGAPVDAWARLASALTPARSAYLELDEGAVVGASPELFLARQRTAVRTAPIKGTRAAGEGEAEALGGSVKDAAENVMIVDLMRNDLSAVCRPGTVAVTGLLEVAPHAGVWHLVSQVEGELPAGTTNARVLAATFPPGSVTGVPKVRALEVMAAAEGEARGVYTGAVGFASPVAGLELAVAIRTVEVAGGPGRWAARLGVGGGVTAGSTPVEEWAECLVKAAPLLTALGLPPGAAGVAGPSGGPADLARPGGWPADPAAGLFETVLVRDGRVVELADHAERLERSWWELNRVALPFDARAELARAGRALAGGWHRLRLDTGPSGRPRTSSEPVPQPVPLRRSRGVEVLLRPVSPAGPPRHKFADRRELERLEALDPGDPAGSAVVLVDPTGLVLEGTRANIIALLDGRVWTPPLDGRILPGVTRQVVLDLAVDLGVPVSTAPLPVTAVARADGVLLTGSLRGVSWVSAGFGRTWAGPDAVGVALADALLDRWGAGEGGRAMLGGCG
jgi:para-aminobenzoate synthetase/4-amino-4-deoxychorismate lyase